MAIENLLVIGNRLYVNGQEFACATGKGGFKTDKREGDGATPMGVFALRQCLYRADRIPQPQTMLPVTPIQADDGWCDESISQFYNLPVKLPFNQSHEKLWREDHIYDLIIPLGYNDAPPQAGKGSAIFMHLAKPGYEPTEGCVALKQEDLLKILPELSVQTHVEIREN